MTSQWRRNTLYLAYFTLEQYMFTTSLSTNAESCWHPQLIMLKVYTYNPRIKYNKKSIPSYIFGFTFPNFPLPSSFSGWGFQLFIPVWFWFVFVFPVSSKGLYIEFWIILSIQDLPKVWHPPTPSPSCDEILKNGGTRVQWIRRECLLMIKYWAWRD